MGRLNAHEKQQQLQVIIERNYLRTTHEVKRLADKRVTLRETENMCYLNVALSFLVIYAWRN